MLFRTSRFVVLAFFSLSISPAYGQSFLERLEGVIGGQQSAPAAEAREPGYLGLTVDEANDAGVVVLDVEANSAAARAGLRKGDRLLSIDDQSVKNLDSMAAMLKPLFAGDMITIKYKREGKRQTAKVTLQAPPPQAPALQRLERRFEEVPAPPPPEANSPRSAFLGVGVATVNDSLRERYGLAINKGVVIERVTRDSPADRAGLPVGAAIVAIDGERIESPEQLAEHVAVHRPGSEAEVSYYRGRQLFRTRVRLAAAPRPEAPLRLGDNEQPPLAEPPPPEPAPGQEGLVPEGPVFEGRRPAGRLLNRLLDEVRQAEQAPPPAANNRDLERYVNRLEDYIDRLERRIVELEAQLKQDRR